ncbi:MAG: hypothetical protein ACK53Y_25660, partial [bacterium]
RCLAGLLRALQSMYAHRSLPGDQEFHHTLPLQWKGQAQVRRFTLSRSQNKSSTHRKEEDSKQSLGIKAVSIKRPQLYRSKEVDSKQSPGR